MAKIKPIICHVGNDATFVTLNYLARRMVAVISRYFSQNLVALGANNVMVVYVRPILPATEMYLEDSSFRELGHY